MLRIVNNYALLTIFFYNKQNAMISIYYTCLLTTLLTSLPTHQINFTSCYEDIKGQLAGFHFRLY